MGKATGGLVQQSMRKKEVGFWFSSFFLFQLVVNFVDAFYLFNIQFFKPIIFENKCLKNF